MLQLVYYLTLPTSALRISKTVYFGCGLVKLSMLSHGLLFNNFYFTHRNINDTKMDLKLKLLGFLLLYQYNSAIKVDKNAT